MGIFKSLLDKKNSVFQKKKSDTGIQQGDTAKAIEHYEKFLSLWKDADPGIVEVEDAREALKRLEKN